MLITDLMDFCELVLSQYGNLPVVIFTEFAERPEFALNEVVVEILEVPASRFSSKGKLVLGMGFGNDVHFMEDEKIRSAAKKRHLRLV